MITGLYKHKILLNAILVLIAYIITFPQFEPDFSIGLDDSYFWAFSHLFFNHYDALKELIYPYGPLAFLKNAVVTGYAFEYTLVYYSIMKVWFIYMFIVSADKFTNRKIISYIFIILILLFLYVDHFIVGLCFIYAMLFLYERKYAYIIVASLIASIGILIKSSIGIACFSLLFVSWGMDYYKTKKNKDSLQIAAIIIAQLFLVGLVVFQNIGLFLEYLINVLRLSFSYSSALSLYKQNNWWYLSIVIVCILIPALSPRKSRTKETFILLLPTLFAIWKHAMTRQDDSHLYLMLSFLFFYWGIYLAVAEMKVVQITFLATISIVLFYSNMDRPWNFNLAQEYINRITGFEKTVFHYNKFKRSFLHKSEINVKPNQLDRQALSIIGQKTVDAYPWELSFFAANKELNWTPRRTLQSGSYARWLDQYSANDFADGKGAEYLIFHYVDDEWNGHFGSIDNRYLLNDNPLTIFNIFNHYTLRLKTDKFLLLEKTNKHSLRVLNKSKVFNTQWDKWIELNNFRDTITRIYVFTHQNILGKVKSFLYQSEQYYIDYLTEEGKLFTFRFIPENANDGLWIHPFIRNPQNTLIEEKVSKIRLRCSYPHFNKNELQYQLESSQYLNNHLPADFNKYFLKNKIAPYLPIHYYNNFNSDKHQKTKDNLVKGNGGFSFTYSIELDSIWSKVDSGVGKIYVESDLKYINNGSDGFYVVAVSESKNDFIKTKPLVKNVKYWGHILNIIELNMNEHRSGLLKIYVHNLGEKNIFIDDFRVRYKAEKHY